MNKYIILFSVVLLFSGCQKLLNPLADNHRTDQTLYSDPIFAEGVLMNAYSRLPTNGYSFNDVATDDAVTNDKFNDYHNIATGQWSALNNPLEQWDNAFTAIMYINKFLAESDSIVWSYRSEVAQRLFNDRNRGEAYGLRAVFMFYLLQAHAGYGANGQLLGVPIITKYMEPGSDFRLPRNTFDQCVGQIYSDLNEAAKLLPLDYMDITDASQLPSQYKDVTIEEYNRVFGSTNRERLSGRIVQAMRAKIALLAASPAYNSDGSTKKWEDAANYAATVLDEIGGVSGLDPKGDLFYTSNNVNLINLAKDIDEGEMLWRSSKEGSPGSLRLEQDNFPPSLYGNGRVNPTQNLVDAFPMANGYPITDKANSGYDPANPYDNRDPRLREYIVVNGDNLAKQPIWTQTGGGDDAVDYIKTSTRTGYYMRKLLREDVNVNPSSPQPKQHIVSRIRYTEIFLIYAEAANEAWGPDGKGSHGYSARDVIGAIRKRAKITQPDGYLASITTKDEMRALIHNERRLELCFEGFRFWDLRRWKDNLNEPALGVTITNGAYTVSTVEKRLYDDYMYYPPIPYNEVVKEGLIQNKGW